MAFAKTIIQQQDKCDSIRSIAFHHYGKKEYQDAKIEFLKAARCYDLDNNFQQAGYVYLNIATIYDEQLMNVDSTIHYIKLSLGENNDTLHQANILKYYGLILSKIGKFDEGLKNIDSSIYLFTLVDYIPGVYVAEFDKAQLLYNKKDFDQCKVIIEKVRNYLISNNKIERLFLLNLLEIKWAHATQNEKKMQALLMENEVILANNKIYQSNIDSFEVYKVRYFK
ncbi:MAG: hypothetical protein IPO26_02265 [Saprospiraceae bacterium]|nr:hypothetical protein [Saprospiraceae bacterium]